MEIASDIGNKKNDCADQDEEIRNDGKKSENQGALIFDSINDGDSKTDEQKENDDTF